MPTWLSSLATKALAQLIARKVELLLAFLSPALAGGLLYLHTEIAPRLSDPTGWLALKAIALSAALFPLPAAVYFWVSPKLKPLSWGVHQDAKTGAYFCSVCLIPNKVHSPMYLSSDGRFWKCHSNSSHKKSNPEFKEPPPPPRPSGPQAWMAN